MTPQVKTLSFVLVGILLLGAGLWLLHETLQAVMAGKQYAGVVWSVRQMSNRLGADIAAVLSLFVVTAGVVYIYAGIVQALPNLERERWFRWVTGLVFGPLILLLLGSAVIVAVARIFRL